MVDGFRGVALMACDGDFSKADYFLDCSIAEYYTRLKDRKQYVTEYNKQFKK